ncbi:unnamed protein product [marine sediment metagenome]|uniref:Peptidase M15C domain-containing protein n=1 Tax=marine sediment metagenome TaxID=412755 RepID=X0WFP6_9ZZZZ
MTWHYSERSLSFLDSCDPRLRALFREALEYQDITIVSGKRGEAEQNELVRVGRSERVYPRSKHNAEPWSLAVDAMPYPVDYNDRERITLFAGFIKGLAAGKFNVRIRWGGDWDGDWSTRDNVFDDLGHFELLPK